MRFERWTIRWDKDRSTVSISTPPPPSSSSSSTMDVLKVIWCWFVIHATLMYVSFLVLYLVILYFYAIFVFSSTFLVVAFHRFGSFACLCHSITSKCLCGFPALEERIQTVHWLMEFGGEIITCSALSGIQNEAMRWFTFGLIITITIWNEITKRKRQHKSNSSMKPHFDWCQLKQFKSKSFAWTVSLLATYCGTKWVDNQNKLIAAMPPTNRPNKPANRIDQPTKRKQNTLSRKSHMCVCVFFLQTASLESFTTSSSLPSSCFYFQSKQ